MKYPVTPTNNLDLLPDNRHGELRHVLDNHHIDTFYYTFHIYL